MAIKVNGTTVIDDSRNFSNIAGGFKTVNGTSVVGSGDISAGASTTHGAVGTYTAAAQTTSSAISAGSTTSGSSLVYGTGIYEVSFNGNTPSGNWGSSGLSGTWRAMSASGTQVSGRYGGNLWVRIS